MGHAHGKNGPGDQKSALVSFKQTPQGGKEGARFFNVFKEGATPIRPSILKKDKVRRQFQKGSQIVRRHALFGGLV
jgi:hypothetical protein